MVDLGRMYRWYKSCMRSAPQAFVPPDEPRTPKSAITRRRLLEVAAQLFVERGFAAVSLADVSTAAGLTKGALYGHFRSKGQLLVEVIRWELAERDAAHQRDGGSTDDYGAAGLFVDPEGRRLRLLEVDAAAAARHDGDVAAGLSDLYEQRHSQIRDAVGHTDDPDTTAWLIAVLAGGIGMKEAAGVPAPDVARIASAIQTSLTALIPTHEK